MNAIENEEKIEPYKLLFPLGTFIGLIGVIIWLFFQARWIGFFPRSAHGHLMFFGLLWSFIAGFLMTAIPKMTSTFSAQLWEIVVAVVLVLLQLVLNIRNLTSISMALFGLQNLFLLFFILRRFVIHRKIPFFGFIFLPVAFLQSFIGIFLFFYQSYDKSLILLFCGEAFVLNLILGLGSRLIPVISRLPNALLPNEASKHDQWTWPLLTLIFINLGYWVEPLDIQKDLGLILRIVGILIAAIKLFKFFKRPSTWSYSGIGLKIAISMLFFGQLLSLSIFGFYLAATHLLYIGGFTLITFMIATRVMLAHGNKSLEYEISSKRILALIGLFLLSALLRFTIMADISNLLLSISVLAFSVAMTAWSVKFLKT